MSNVPTRFTLSVPSPDQQKEHTVLDRCPSGSAAGVYDIYLQALPLVLCSAEQTNGNNTRHFNHIYRCRGLGVE